MDAILRDKNIICKLFLFTHINADGQIDGAYNRRRESEKNIKKYFADS